MSSTHTTAGMTATQNTRRKSSWLAAIKPIAASGPANAPTYRRNVQLASGRFAMLDDGIGFSLVPWKPVIEQRLGQTMTAVIRGNGASWKFGRQRGSSVA
jgi:hypothetical protein